MKIKNLFLFALSLVFSWGYCDDTTNQKAQGVGMNQIIEHQKEKWTRIANK